MNGAEAFRSWKKELSKYGIVVEPVQEIYMKEELGSILEEESEK